MINCKGEDCGFCRHWAQCHNDDPGDLSPLEIVFLDQVNDPGPREEAFPHLKHLEGKWMANWGACLQWIGCMVLIFGMMPGPSSTGGTTDPLPLPPFHFLPPKLLHSLVKFYVSVWLCHTPIVLFY